MGLKITEYPLKTAFDDNDLMDFSSYDGVSTYTSEKLTLASLKSYLDGQLNFLTSFTETDPVFTASPAASVINSGGGTQFLADDGTYKTVSTPVDVVGIANTSGVYTYYSTLQAAIDAASAGQTVEVFSDITETTDITVTLKAGVKINGNGHTYTLDFNSATHALTANTVNGIYHIFNLIVDRKTTSSGSALYTVNNSVRCYCSGSAFYANGTGQTIRFDSGSSSYLESATAINTGTGLAILATTNSSTIVYCKGYATGASAIYGGVVKYCDGKSTISYGVSGFDLYNCTGDGVGTNGGITLITGGTCRKCIGRSSAGRGIVGNQAYIYDSIGIGTLDGILSGFEIHNSQGYSSTGYGINNTILNPIIVNCISISNASPSVILNLGTGANIATVRNCMFQSKWNNAGGHAIEFENASAGTAAQTESDVITNNNLIVANTSAYCINFVGAGGQPVRNVKLANNTYEGAATAIAPDINQAVTNTQDSQGNILI